MTPLLHSLTRSRLFAHLAVASLAVLLAACATTSSFRSDELASAPAIPEGGIASQVFLVGDLGRLEPGEPAPVLDAMRQRLQRGGEDDVLVLLGDNLIGGLPDSTSPNRAAAEAHLRRVLSVADGFPGRVVVLAGDHEWNPNRGGGPDNVRRLEAFVEAELDYDKAFLPGEGLPGPYSFEIVEGFRLVALDTGWWFTDADRPTGEVDGNEIFEDGDVLQALADLVQDKDDDVLMVVGHHPMRSNGEHGGYFSAGDQLSPAPLVGTGRVLYRRFFGGQQDLTSPRYRDLIEVMDQIFEPHEMVIYAGAHDRSLQYFTEGEVRNVQHYLVAGSGARAEPVGRGNGLLFGAATTGYSVVSYYEDGRVWLEMRGVEGGSEEVLLAREIRPRPPEGVDPEIPTDFDVPDYTDSTVVAAPGPEYDVSGFRRFVFGNGYRDVWATPVEAPVLDLGAFAGGLTPIKRGGGMQTISLRMQGADGHQYVLRAVNKDARRSLGLALSETIVADVVQDLISSTNPYAAYTIPTLSEAAGIYYTNPQLYWIPDDPRLGAYRDLMGNRLALVEERPDDDMSGFASFGNSDDVVSAPKLFEELDDDNDNRVDQLFFARSRLFDMFLGDWDRHPDQWRWAGFDDPDGQGTLYRPIPRDRDFVYWRLNGLLPSIGKYVNPRYHDFGADFGNTIGLTENGIEQDRRLTAELTREDWLRIAGELEAALTDEVLARAFDTWPEEIQAMERDRTLDILRWRRDNITGFAERFYDLNADVVPVVTSDKHERFEITRGNGQTEVVVYKTSREGEIRQEIFRRTFLTRETGEIRLYGQGGDDRFVVTGQGSGGDIRVIIVGGPGEDELTDTSRGGGSVLFYDTPEGGRIAQMGSNTVDRRSDDPGVNRQDVAHFRHVTNSFGPILGFNPTDGVILGGAYTFNSQGFRREPLASSHTIGASLATSTLGVAGFYDGVFYEAFGEDTDIVLSAEGSTARRVRNFYGIGNGTDPATTNPGVALSSEFFQVQVADVRFVPAVRHRVRGGGEIRFGPLAELLQVNEGATLRFIGTEAAPNAAAGVEAEDFGTQLFAGAVGSFEFETVDNAASPGSGFVWNGLAEGRVGLNDAPQSHLRVGSELTAYIPFSRSPQVTLAARVGGEHLFGNYPFYAAATLGGGRLRGFRRDRFAGETAFWTGGELRIAVLQAPSYAGGFDVGLLGFVDTGRVWAEGGINPSNAFHTGYGFGVWANLLDFTSAVVSFGFSDEESFLARFGLGFDL